MSINELTREARPPYVRFERRPVEDKAASLREGRYIAKDVDFVLITPPYSRDCVEQKVSQWLVDIERSMRDGRVPENWVSQWKEGYQKWKNGEEMPLHGTPIKGWGVVSPAQQAMLIAIGCLTVEDLAAINDEGLRRIGMGAIELRDKARNWMASVKDHGEVTLKMSALEHENRVLKNSLETLTKQVDALKAMIPADKPARDYPVEDHREITADDLIDDSGDDVEKDSAPNHVTIEEAYRQKFGKPPHHKMKPETIMAALSQAR